MHPLQPDQSVAVSTPPRAAPGPERQMPLREHLAELRRRLVRSSLAILAGGAVGWFLYDPLVSELTEPIKAVAAAENRTAELNFPQVASSFDLKVKMSIWLGVIASSPVWTYQLWAFITPGLTRKERRYAVVFVAVAVPLFLAGIWLAWQFIPNAVKFLTSFTPEGGSNIIVAQDYLGFVMRLLLGFGIAFLLPVILVGLNLVGLVRGGTLVRSWRWVTVLCVTFAAIATPTPDITAMFILALPMLLLFVIAIAFCVLNDRRRDRRPPEFGARNDSTASPM
jgi:sec-independent protein translocase protein TatC